MSVAALFRGKWGTKSQDTPDKHPTALALPSHAEYYDDDDDDESRVGLSREPIRRNSRFYRSMRKKRMAASESSESKNTSNHMVIKVVYLYLWSLHPMATCQPVFLKVWPTEPPVVPETPQVPDLVMYLFFHTTSNYKQSACPSFSHILISFTVQ